jgi:Na+/proline symporter
LTDYVHTVIILVIIFIFAFTTYATSDILGSPSKVYGLLVAAAERKPVDGNAGGSLLTMRSREGAIFFVINIIGNFGTVFWFVAHQLLFFLTTQLFDYSSINMIGI